ncbi:DUF1835 domain-containing protein [Labilibaculum manganireducens]|uniref:DUF1835 domain-containing protein n=1 Tax=Labilibaculum manganireducens TaxID=1940525 RepID=UPI0029F524F1|nr:DUF1835 domain-containing protein [Labilibaculum manganireducens]
MKKQYHILNGDSLKHQLPEAIQGEFIVARECLVDGNVEGNNLTELIHTRATFISLNYEGYNEQNYYEKTVPEFLKMQGIPDNVDINFWFEDDLFCQVNFWFVLNLIYENYKNQSIFLIRPKFKSGYSFGGMNEKELITAFQTKIKIELSEIIELSKLWKLYQQNDCNKMLKIAKKLEIQFPFLYPAIIAQRDRFPQKGNLGKPTQSLIQIMDELNTIEFEPVFSEFSKREGIYGFGDLHVKRLINKITNNR